MYTLGIPDRQKRRTLGYLKQSYIDFEEHPSMEGFFDIACTGLTKKQVKVDIEGDVLRVSYTKKDDKEDKDLHIYHSGIAKRNFNLGWKIARRFDLSKIEGSMKDGLLKLYIPLTPESKPKTVSIK